MASRTARGMVTVNSSAGMPPYNSLVWRIADRLQCTFEVGFPCLT
ncbi:hypothetical protein [Gemmata massiliana]|nr:hypothetical protein [Gemmata massiliana]